MDTLTAGQRDTRRMVRELIQEATNKGDATVLLKWPELQQSMDCAEAVKLVGNIWDLGRLLRHVASTIERGVSYIKASTIANCDDVDLCLGHKLKTMINSMDTASDAFSDRPFSGTCMLSAISKKKYELKKRLGGNLFEMGQDYWNAHAECKAALQTVYAEIKGKPPGSLSEEQMSRSRSAIISAADCLTSGITAVRDSSIYLPEIRIPLESHPLESIPSESVPTALGWLLSQSGPILFLSSGCSA